jgi:hypothetical protein
MAGLDPSRKAAIDFIMTSANNAGRESRAKRSRQKIIGDQLKRFYDDVTREPVPDEFLRLLELADKKSKGLDGDVS